VKSINYSAWETKLKEITDKNHGFRFIYIFLPQSTSDVRSVRWTNWNL